MIWNYSIHFIYNNIKKEMCSRRYIHFESKNLFMLFKINFPTKINCKQNKTKQNIKVIEDTITVFEMS